MKDRDVVVGLVHALNGPLVPNGSPLVGSAARVVTEGENVSQVGVALADGRKVLLTVQVSR